MFFSAASPAELAAFLAAHRYLAAEQRGCTVGRAKPQRAPREPLVRARPGRRPLVVAPASRGIVFDMIWSLPLPHALTVLVQFLALGSGSSRGQAQARLSGVRLSELR